MDDISEEAKSSEMRPEQIQRVVGKSLSDKKDIFSINIAPSLEDETDDDLSFFGVGGPA